MKWVEVTIDMKRMGLFLESEPPALLPRDHSAHIDDEADTLKSTGSSKKFAVTAATLLKARLAKPIYQHGKARINRGEMSKSCSPLGISSREIAFVDFAQSLQDGGAELDLRT